MATVRDPEPWVVHFGLGEGNRRYASWVPGALDQPRMVEPPRKSAVLVKFREATLLLGVGAFYNARCWLDFMDDFPGHLEAGVPDDELDHLVRVLHRLVNVYGEA
ncbi:hypothetical protein [Leucobacter japonicus]|uniref:hypothetical protein n=1 Tax=Leucobacter japonicus TaxID=1461259 RepID=UPI0012E1E7AA|nr:hypothetical protein [Leucobacter japonicus]